MEEEQNQGLAPERLELLWGAEAIGEYIGRSTRATFHLLEKGQLPAKKVGNVWVVSCADLNTHFSTATALSNAP